MRTMLCAPEITPIQTIAREAKPVCATSHIETRPLELGLLSWRERELSIASAGHLGDNPLFEHWL